MGFLVALPLPSGPDPIEDQCRTIRTQTPQTPFTLSCHPLKGKGQMKLFLNFQCLHYSILLLATHKELKITKGGCVSFRFRNAKI